MRASVLLPDVPARDDQFQGHSAVARALRTTVAGPGSGLLALVGPFGSGKSTVVELLRRPPGGGDGPAPQDDPVRVVVYDAWSHQADALRRTLLAAVLRDLDPDRSHLPARLHDAVGPPRTQTRTTTRTGPGPWGLWAGLFAVLLPLVVVFVTPVAQNLAISYEEGRLIARSVDHHARLAAIVAVAALGGAAAVAWARSFPRSRPYSPVPDRDPDDATSLVVQRVDAVETVTTPAGELDADAFEDHLRTAARLWLADGDGRALVVVLDDLDRFPLRDREKARAVLRSLHRVASGPDPAEGLWVVVPDSPGPTAVAVPAGQNADGVTTAGGEDWTDKLFLARFVVPPALPGAAAEHLEGLLRTAFPEHPADEIEAAARAWLWAGRASVPRRSVRFVNDLVALYRQHGDDPIPLRVQAAYLATPDPLSVQDIDRYRLETALDVPAWIPLAAALHYGLPPTRAVEAFVRKRIESAVGVGDRGVVESLFDEHPAASLRVLEQTVHSMATGRTPHLIDNAAWVLGIAPDAAPTRRAWRHLLQESGEVGEWQELNPDGAAGRGLGLLLTRADTDESTALLAALNRPLLTDGGEGRVLQDSRMDPDKGIPIPDAITEDEVEDWVAIASTALGIALAEGADPASFDDYHVPGSPTTHLATLRHAATRSAPGVHRLLRPRDPDAVVAHLAQLTREVGKTSDLAAAVDRLLPVDAPWDWTPLLDAVHDRVRKGTEDHLLMGTPLTLGDAQALAATLLLFAHHPRSSVRDDAQSNLTDLGADGSLLDLARIGKAPDDESDLPEEGAPALAILLHAAWPDTTDAPEPPERVRAALGVLQHADARRLAALVERFHARPAAEQLDAAGLPAGPQQALHRLHRAMDVGPPGDPDA